MRLVFTRSQDGITYTASGNAQNTWSLVVVRLLDRYHNSASWTGIPRPRCTEYDRASTIFRPVIVPVRRAVSHRMLRCRRVSLAKPCYDQSYDVPPQAIG